MSNLQESTKTIVYVEDDGHDAGFHMLVPDVLSDDGHEVVIKKTLAEALGHIGSIAAGEVELPDAFLLDYSLDPGDPTATGDVVHQAIREQLGDDIPVIGFSSNAWAGTAGPLYRDVTKDGLFELPEVVAGLPAHTAVGLRNQMTLQ
ncbi:MAG TPA: hypothetical protein VGO07_05155 [Candidatus Saccharimonadales bacterium]|jgi:hypothetical protein|nr:hypothetical protein [Candidatus Saccharimonadales bacterium]